MKVWGDEQEVNAVIGEDDPVWLCTGFGAFVRGRGEAKHLPLQRHL